MLGHYIDGTGFGRSLLGQPDNVTLSYRAVSQLLGGPHPATTPLVSLCLACSLFAFILFVVLLRDKKFRRWPNSLYAIVIALAAFLALNASWFVFWGFDRSSLIAFDFSEDGNTILRVKGSPVCVAQAFFLLASSHAVCWMHVVLAVQLYKIIVMRRTVAIEPIYQGVIIVALLSVSLGLLGVSFGDVLPQAGACRPSRRHWVRAISGISVIIAAGIWAVLCLLCVLHIRAIVQRVPLAKAAVFRLSAEATKRVTGLMTKTYYVAGYFMSIGFLIVLLVLYQFAALDRDDDADMALLMEWSTDTSTLSDGRVQRIRATDIFEIVYVLSICVLYVIVFSESLCPNCGEEEVWTARVVDLDSKRFRGQLELIGQVSSTRPEPPPRAWLKAAFWKHASYFSVAKALSENGSHLIDMLGDKHSFRLSADFAHSDANVDGPDRRASPQSPDAGRSKSGSRLQRSHSAGYLPTKRPSRAGTSRPARAKVDIRSLPDNTREDEALGEIAVKPHPESLAAVRYPAAPTQSQSEEGGALDFSEQLPQHMVGHNLPPEFKPNATFGFLKGRRNNVQADRRRSLRTSVGGVLGAEAPHQVPVHLVPPESQSTSKTSGSSAKSNNSVASRSFWSRVWRGKRSTREDHGVRSKSTSHGSGVSGGTGLHRVPPMIMLPIKRASSGQNVERLFTRNTRKATLSHPTDVTVNNATKPSRNTTQQRSNAQSTVTQPVHPSGNATSELYKGFEAAPDDHESGSRAVKEIRPRRPSIEEVNEHYRQQLAASGLVDVALEAAKDVMRRRSVDNNGTEGTRRHRRRSSELLKIDVGFAQAWIETAEAVAHGERKDDQDERSPAYNIQTAPAKQAKQMLGTSDSSADSAVRTGSSLRISAAVRVRRQSNHSTVNASTPGGSNFSSAFADDHTSSDRSPLAVPKPRPSTSSLGAARFVSDFNLPGQMPGATTVTVTSPPPVSQAASFPSDALLSPSRPPLPKPQNRSVARALLSGDSAAETATTSSSAATATASALLALANRLTTPVGAAKGRRRSSRAFFEEDGTETDQLQGRTRTSAGMNYLMPMRGEPAAQIVVDGDADVADVAVVADCQTAGEAKGSAVTPAHLSISVAGPVAPAAHDFGPNISPSEGNT